MATPLPPAVQRQLEQAEAQLQQAQPPVAPPPPPEPPAAPPAPVAPPPPAPAPVAPPTASAQEDWQQKYRTLQGMFQRTVPELQAQTRRYESELASLRQQMAAMSEALTKVQQTPPTEQSKPEIDPRDARAFGEDMVEMVQRYAQRTYEQMRAQFQTAFANLEKRVQVIEQTVTGVSQRTESSMENQFYATLDQLVPDWKSINASGEWLEWLGEVDPIYNVPRQTALDAAFERRDPTRVSAVFKKFKESRPAPRQPESVAPLVTPSEGGGGNPNPPAPPARAMLLQKDIQKFYDDLTKGRYRGREDEVKRIEQEIDLAAREGRII